MPRKPAAEADYTDLLARVSAVLGRGRRSAAPTVNAVLGAGYRQVGRHVVEHEQGGKRKAGYGDELLKRLTADLVARFGRGFSRANLQQMRTFYLGWQICQTVSGKSQVRVRCELPDAAAAGKAQTASAELAPVASLVTVAPLDPAATLPDAFPLPWSHYVRLMVVRDDSARWFPEDEAVHGGWSVRRRDRPSPTLPSERTGAAKNKAAVLAPGRGDPRPVPAGVPRPDGRVRRGRPGGAIVRKREAFLPELGTGFTFVARPKRVRVGDPGDSHRRPRPTGRRLVERTGKRQYRGDSLRPSSRPPGLLEVVAAGRRRVGRAAELILLATPTGGRLRSPYRRLSSVRSRPA